jgi:hypothetical protein
MTCPGCQSETTDVVLESHYGRQIAIDLCHACNSVCFDGQEDLQLAPGAVLKLFEAMGRASQSARAPVSNRKVCPRCHTGLLRTHDRIRQTPYEYFRCSKGHGRYLSFSAFLRARQFVRDMTDAELSTLRLSASIIKCANCGASIDIKAHSACDFCKAPVAVLDAGQLSKALEELEAAEGRRAKVDPSWPLRAAQARRQTEAVFEELNRRGSGNPKLDLIEAGLSLFAGVLDGLD